MQGLKTNIDASTIEKLELEKSIRSHNIPQKLARRCQIIKMAVEGVEYGQIAKELKIQPSVVTKWIKRWAATVGQDLTLAKRLADLPRSGAPSTFMPEQICQIIAVACEHPSVYNRPITHWSGRELADEVTKQGIVDSISERHTNRILNEVDLRPHKSQYWLNDKPDERKDEKKNQRNLSKV